VAQGISPEFKPQYRPPKKKTPTSLINIGLFLVLLLLESDLVIWGLSGNLSILSESSCWYIISCSYYYLHIESVAVSPLSFLVFIICIFQVHNLLYKLSISWWGDISFSTDEVKHFRTHLCCFPSWSFFLDFNLNQGLHMWPVHNSFYLWEYKSLTIFNTSELELGITSGPTMISVFAKVLQCP
jgi:hypothetical protein